MAIGADEMIIKLDKGLLNLLLRNPHQSSHQDHKREKDLRYNAPESMGKKDLLPRHNGKNKEETTGKHHRDQNGKENGKQKR